VANERFCPRDGAYLVDAQDLLASGNDPLLGRRISEFAIVARVGTGGMGTVYRAIQIGMDRQVALKVLRTDLTDDPQVVQRFLQEAKATARLQHRNLATTYTSGSTSDGLFYIAMEYIYGGSLAQLIEKSWTRGESGPDYALELPQVMRLFGQIVSALAHAHRLGIVHRDLKPDNVLLQHDDDEGEQAKIVDFGIAKILHNPDGKSGLVKTDSRANLGTALYMAPERFAGAPGDPRMDVYALGLLLHEMVTGLLPFASRYEDRDNPNMLLHKRLTMEVPALSASPPLSPQLVALHADLLDREPQRRPAHAGEVRQRLRDIPEAASLRMSQDLLRRSGNLPAEGPASDPALGEELLGSRSIPPLAPAIRSLPSAPPAGAASPLPVATRSLPPLSGSRSLPPVGPASTSPAAPGLSGSSLPPSTNSLRKSDPNRDVPTSSPGRSGTSTPAAGGSSITRWLVAGCLILLVLLILLTLS